MQDLAGAICKQRPSEEGGASYAHDRVPELLRLIGRRHLLVPDGCSARAEIYETAQPQSSGPGDVSAAFGERSEPFGHRQDDRQLWLRRKTGYLYGDPLAQEAFSRTPREERASAIQARESIPESPTAAGPHPRPAYRADGEIAIDDDSGSDVSGPPDERPFSLQPHRPRWVAVAGVAGAVSITMLAAVGYDALSVSNTAVQAPVIAGNIVESKAPAAGETVYGGEFNQQAATSSWMNQPKNVRTFTIRPDAGAADTSAPEARAHPNADARRGVGVAGSSAAALSDSQSETGTSPTSPPGTNVDEQKKVRTSAALPQVGTRDGLACQASAGSGGYWAWRIIDGRKCWYEGKPGMSKDNLRWVR